MDLKEPLSFSEQVQKLIAHGLIIEDEQEAEKILSRINYYRLSGYMLQFRESASSSDLVSGHSLSEVMELYKFDCELRQLLRGYLEQVEVAYKTLISNTFSLEKCIVSPHDQHYNRDNYFNKTGFDHILENFQREKGYFEDSLIVKHHVESYSGKMPLWVMVELMSFSSLSKLYSAMYLNSQKRIASIVGVGPNTLANHLHCLSVLRNKCSHGARLYNTRMSPPAKLSATLLRRYPTLDNASLFAYILVVKWRLPTSDLKRSFKKDICSLIDKYTGAIDLSYIGFPANYKTIL